ncbi:MAG TPA: hypothetical protein VNA20_05910 [Frankiaceae bacterium]|nr:hypothetical protein [Frankiaceae bacterium]
MRLPRLPRAVVAATALAWSLGAAEASAAQTLAFTFVIPCNTGSMTTPAGITLPSGRYLVTVAGACSVNLTDSFSTTVPGTPCTAPVVGTIPCTSPVPVNNVPGPLCRVTNGTVTVNGCYGTTTWVGCGGHRITINGACVNGPAATVWFGGGPMTATFNDSNYADNAGAFVVTVAWTPL